MTPPLTGPHKAILDLLVAGRTFNQVCDIGAYRRSWKPSDVHTTMCRWLPDRVPAKLTNPHPTAPALPPPPARPAHRRQRRPIEHGTANGYFAHLRHRTSPCDPCRNARNAADTARRHGGRTASGWRPPQVTTERTALLNPDRAALLEQLCLGVQPRDLAKQLGLAEVDARSEIRAVLHDLDARDRAHAVALVLSGRVAVRITT